MASLVLVFGCVLLALVGLNFVVWVHEGGHYVAAKACGKSVAEFSLGIGPVVRSFVFRETRFVLRRYPVIGFVLFVRAQGDDTDIAELEPDRESRRFALLSRPEGWMCHAGLLTKLFILISGPLANVLLYFGLSALCYDLSEDRTYPATLTKVARIPEGLETPLAEGDLIEWASETDRPAPAAVMSLLARPDAGVTFSVRRNGERLTLLVPTGGEAEKIRLSQPREEFGWTDASARIFGQYAVPDGTARWECSPYYIPSMGCGPIGILHLGVRPISHGVVPYLAWIAVLSFCLGLTNLVPIPPLDGGRIVLSVLRSLLYAIYLAALYIVWTFPAWAGSSVRMQPETDSPKLRRDVLTTVENGVCLTGACCLACVMLFVSVVDVLRILVSIRTL